MEEYIFIEYKKDFLDKISLNLLNDKKLIENEINKNIVKEVFKIYEKTGNEKEKISNFSFAEKKIIVENSNYFNFYLLDNGIYEKYNNFETLLMAINK